VLAHFISISSPLPPGCAPPAGKAFSTLGRADLARVAYAAGVSPGACRRTLCVLDEASLIIAAPFLRALEAWEAPPFDAFVL
jgi:hypothetical protein